MTRNFRQAPAVAPCEVATHPLFAHGRNISSVVPQWKQGGIVFPQAACIDSKVYGCLTDPCDEDAEPVAVNITSCDAPCELAYAGPFTVYAAVDNCGPQTREQLEEMAETALGMDFGRRVASAMVKNFGGLSSIATDITGGSDPKPSAIGVGLLSQNRVGCTWYSVPETIIPLLVVQGLITYSEGLPFMLGQPVIPVPTNIAPTTNDGATGYWIYGHGPVEYAYDSEARVEFTTEKLENDRCAIARRDAMVRVDPCRVFAVSVTVPSC